MMFGIVIPTYKRADGKTPFYLKRLLNSIFNQFCKEFKIFLIGDNYENTKDLFSLVSDFPKEKICIKNLPVAIEREKYKDHHLRLWCSGGVNATNVGIETAIKEGFSHICCPDHDDYWTSHHLSTIEKVLSVTASPWVCTKSIYSNHGVLPNLIIDQMGIVEFAPQSGMLIKSSVCMDFTRISFRFRDVFSETGCEKPADADMWDRCAEFLVQNKLKSYAIDIISCIHDEEGFVLRGGENGI
jgi:glycosyltransferase involved in cell wall biosynthesis